MEQANPIPVLTIIGRSGSGKTTLLERLIPELKRRGRRVATIKHHSHSGFEVDQPGKDSWRHARAGAVQVVIAAPDKIASYRSLEDELPLSEVVREVHGADLVLVEGYKQAGYPSIEVLRQAVSLERIGSPGQCIAVVSDACPTGEVPFFTMDDIEGIADFIEKTLWGRRTP